MRLEKIKLAGFKSFVDPTSVHIPSNLVGIVGPNGCGKSNVIDAVRWVMGESSAKMLRGESMADVIFNGSNTRKPVGQASIELVFDNADGSAGGQYAAFNQISVRRLVTRDGQSNYFLNGSRCRRRDITDLFLGTGLGPRSYSIIEQGMISRLIEARPEDLRLFLEEAAGISKYKERRKETENRIRHTRENLDRLNDLRDELRKQIEHLRRQAGVAQKYKELKEAERQLRAELLALRRSLLEQQLADQERMLAEGENQREAASTRQRGLEARIHRERERYTESNDGFNEVQGRFYAVGSEIGRIEQAMRFAKDNRQALEEQLRRVERELAEAEQNRGQDHRRLEETRACLATEEPRRQELAAGEAQAEQRMGELEAGIGQRQAEWEAFNREAAEPAQTAQVERTKMNHLEQRDGERRHRRGRLETELEGLRGDELNQQLVELEEQLAEAQLRLAEREERRPLLLEQIRQMRADAAAGAAKLADTRSELQRLGGRLSALSTLQAAALGEQDDHTDHWLKGQGLGECPRLARLLEVEPTWQNALEQVLGELLQASQVEDLLRLGDAPEAFTRGRLAFISPLPGAGRDAAQTPWLLDKTASQPLLGELLAGIRTADTLEEAWQVREQLGPGESVITPDGVWLGRNWLRLERAVAEGGGVLEREREIKALSHSIAQLQGQEQQLIAAQEAAQEALRRSEAEREQLQGEITAADRALAALRSELSGKRARQEQLRSRHAQLLGELEELDRQGREEREEGEEARMRLHEALERMESFAERREQLAAGREALGRELEAARLESREIRQGLREVELHIGALRSTEQALSGNLEREAGRLEQLAERVSELRLQLEESGEPLERHAEELEVQLGLRVEVEKALGEARTTLETLEVSLRQLEAERTKAEQEVAQQGERLNHLRVHRQELLVRAKTLEEQLKETGFDYPQLRDNLAAEADEANWERQLMDLDARIRRLGPINLAAIEEYQEREERSRYLEEQHQDIRDSLDTLENAMRKIDKETRGRFKETFDQVNTGLKEKFPRLFGGGHAYLELTGEDLLNTGVTIMARPPGKRNSSIHLLSGGEKALTAVAMVFSIFELNPAPFCMLDEVDAPLDDANVGRFCELVKAMSDRVQFIIISHNKITMEIAHQLMGVTMHEPGVSRLVSVDVNEAVKLAAA